jgi:hypothetical protein
VYFQNGLGDVLLSAMVGYPQLDHNYNTHRNYTNGTANNPYHCNKGRPRWEDNIKKVLMEIGWEGVDWIHLAQDRDRWRASVDTVMNIRLP